MYFGDNGVPLDKIENEKILETELKSKSSETISLTVISILASSTLCLFVARTQQYQDLAPFVISLCLTTMFFALIPAFTYFSEKAVEEGLLSKTLLSKSKHSHVPGALILAFAIVIAGLFFMARYLHLQYESPQTATITLENNAGLFVLALVGCAFLAMIALPRIGSSRKINKISSEIHFMFSEKSIASKVLTIIGNGASRIDSWLVYVVAPAVGVTLTKTRARYSIIALYLLPCALLAWYLPAILGIFPILAAFIVALSITRRWAWVEADRSVILRNPKVGTAQLKVGVDQDLRDEALLALLSLIFMLPLAMRQADMIASDILGQQCLFQLRDLNQCVPRSQSFINWLAFFGTELAKAVPFLDWVDIYNVDSKPNIESQGPYSYHIVFVARAIVDLVFLAALLQAVSSSIKLIQHKKLFFDREISILDPIVEKVELEKLAHKSNGSWTYATKQMQKFKHYDNFRLSLLKVTSKPDTVLHNVAAELQRMQKHTPSKPDEIFLEAVARTKDHDLTTISQAYENATLSNSLNFHIMKFALQALNEKSDFTRFRAMLVGQLSNPKKYTRNQELVSFFRDLAYGQGRDSHADVRKRLVSVLKWAAQEKRFQHRPKRTLKNMALFDRAQNVRTEAQKALILLNSDTEQPNFAQKEKLLT